MYENRTMKPFEIVLKVEGGLGRKMKGENLIKIYYKYT
jgi:hypothetical protein